VATDYVDKIQTEIQSRLRELEPLVAEYERLTAANAALGDVPQTGNGASARPSRQRPGRPPGKRASTSTPSSAAIPAERATRPRRRRRRGKRAPRGANREAILRMLEASSSDASVSDIVNATGVNRVTAYQLLGKLEREGAVTRREETNGPRPRALYRLRPSDTTAG
jgi:DNA-binding transcriptional ArsR family regulator